MIKSSLLTLCTVFQVCHATSPLPITSATQSVTTTGWQLVRSIPQGNVVVSPFSVWSAIGMAHVGAVGETASQMAGALNAPNNAAFFAQHITEFEQTFSKNKDPRVELLNANRIWVQHDLPLEQLFVANLQKQFNSTAGMVNFRNQPEISRQTINQWIEQKTHQRIKDLLPAGSVGPQSALVLTNALYLKAPWTQPFQPQATQINPFHLNAKQKVQVPLMSQRLQAMAGKMGRGDDASIVCELPYANGQFKMVLYVPDRVDGLVAVLANLEQAKPELVMQPVNIVLPKWKAQQSIKLNDALQKLGMKKAFDRRSADFSGLRADNDLFISQVLHQSFVEVNEAGTEAAAATGVVMMMRSSLPIDTKDPLDIRADRPFAWAIVETRTGTPLFTGVLRDPR